MKPTDALQLLAANACFLVAGAGILRLLGFWRSVRDLLFVVAIAYMAGVAVVGVLATIGLSVGLSVSGPEVLVLCGLLGTAGFLRKPDVARRPTARPGGAALVVSIAAAVALVGYLAVLLLVSYREPMGAVGYDGWAIWLTKAKAIYLLGGLDERVFAGQAYSSINRDYPLLVPAVEAIDFHFMRGMATGLLHLQFWLLLAGFVAAVAQILRDRVQPVLLWPALLMVAAAPAVLRQLDLAAGDLVLATFFTLGALAAWRFVDEADPRWLALAVLFLAAALATKRDALGFAAAFFLALGIATYRRRRGLRLVTAGLGVAVATIVPWYVWIARHHVPSKHPASAFVNPAHLASTADRIGPALNALASQSFRLDRWLLVLPLLLLVAPFVVVRTRAASGTFALLLLGLLFVWLVWALWADPFSIASLAVRGADRLVTTPLLVAGVFLPVLLAELTREGGPARVRDRTGESRGAAERGLEAPTR